MRKFITSISIISLSIFLWTAGFSVETIENENISNSNARVETPGEKVNGSDADSLEGFVDMARMGTEEIETAEEENRFSFLTKFPFMQRKFLNNSIAAYLIALAILLGLIILVLIFHKLFMKKMQTLVERTESTIDDFVVTLVCKYFLPLMYFGAFYFAVNILTLSETLGGVFKIIAIIVLSFSILRFITAIVKYILEQYWMRKETDQSKITTLKGLFPAINIVIWGIGVIFILDNLGFDISAVIAGLGIGGIAIALASQALLGDLFSYFSMLFDKPFEIGDFIIIEGYMGSIEKIGIKTTRIRSLGGEQIIFSNTDLTGSRVRNYKRMSTRRVVFKIGVTYETSIEKMGKINDIIKSAVDKISDAKFDRSHFSSYGDFSLVFEVVYIVQTGDYNRYMDIQQDINFSIMEAFAKEKIEFAFPTQTLYVKKDI